MSNKKDEKATTGKFSRGIKKELFIQALNELRKDKDSFWFKFTADNDIVIAIRDNYLNVYYKGQSVGKIEFVKGKICGNIHNKYVGIAATGYTIFNETGCITNKLSTIKNLSELDALKKKIENHVGKEKMQSYSKVITNKDAILDVEVSIVEKLVENPIKRGDYKISSIDYVELEKDGTLVFFEAKHIENPEIKSRTIPKVIEQIKRYERVLDLRKEEIIESYNLVLKNKVDLGLCDNKFLNNTKLKINSKPNLIIFGAQNGQTTEWKGKEQIINSLGKERVKIFSI